MWESWVAFNEGLLKSPADRDVLARAALNIPKVIKGAAATKGDVVEVETTETEEDEDIIAGPDTTDRVLVQKSRRAKTDGSRQISHAIFIRISLA